MAEIEIGKIVNEISRQVQEDEENFIFTSLQSFSNQMTQRVVSKKELEKALINYYGNRMTGNEYQELASRTMSGVLAMDDQIRHALFGMTGELGEIHSFFQKFYQGHDIDTDHLKKEVGDLLWFIAEFCTASGWKLEDIMKMNIEKLKARYPEGFTADKSLHRREGDV